MYDMDQLNNDFSRAFGIYSYASFKETPYIEDLTLICSYIKEISHYILDGTYYMESKSYNDKKKKK